MFKRLLLRKIKNKHSYWVVTDILSEVIKRNNGEKIWYELSVRMKKGGKKKTEKLIFDNYDSSCKMKKGEKIKCDE